MVIRIRVSEREVSIQMYSRAEHLVSLGHGIERCLFCPVSILVTEETLFVPRITCVASCGGRSASQEPRHHAATGPCGIAEGVGHVGQGGSGEDETNQFVLVSWDVRRTSVFQGPLHALTLQFTWGDSH